ncbi:MAG: hypothetical protein IPO19_13810 [Rhodoferax sp.]|nr:hypothetical protein [Rhodoferax sp.]
MPSPSAAASSGATMNPAPVQLHAGRGDVGVGLQYHRAYHARPHAQISMNQPSSLGQRDRHFAKLAGLLRSHGE